MKYILYITVNKVNGKIYVGVHKTDNPDKFDGYIGCGVWIKGGNKLSNPITAFHHAYNKYGCNNFTRHTLAVFDNEEDAYNLEEQLVTKEFIKSDKNYNLTTGGNGGSQECLKKEVHQYSLDGEYIASFKSLSEAGYMLNPEKPKLGLSAISSVITGNKETAYGYQWSATKVRFLKKAKQPRPVHMFTLEGEYVKTWVSSYTADQALGVTNVYVTATNRRRSAGHMWSFEMDYPKCKQGRDIV